MLYCHVQANARHNSLCGLHGERIKVRIAAPAVDGGANKALIRFIATAFSVSASEVTLVRGTSQRHKHFLIKQPRQLPPACEIEPAGRDQPRIRSSA